MHFAFLFPRFKLLSGAERLILKLAGSLIDRGIRISILCHQFDDSCLPILPKNAELRQTGKKLDFFSNRYANAALDYFRTSSLTEFVSSEMNAVCCFGPGLTAAPLIRAKNIPALYFCYEPPRFLYVDREMIQNRLGVFRILSGPIFDEYRKRDQTLVGGVDAILSNSEFGRKQIQDFYHRDAVVITHGLDGFQVGTRKAEIRAMLGLKDSDIVVTSVNYLHPRKRLDLFIQTVQRARQSYDAIYGLIVGGGPEEQHLRRIAGEAIRFAGFVPESALYEYYQSADIYLHTSRLETFGLSVIEASGNKLPVVSVNEGGPMETILEHQTGYLRTATAESLAEPLIQLAQNKELRERLGAGGFEYVRSKYTWTQAADDFLRSYNRNN
ncbi:MAG: hypothetical protein C5B54_01730 [Acidobacteria bacterium]|nr:MAG: hypothetical protein C5B54_01730 [Acidobacteriota bacterium]